MKSIPPIRRNRVLFFLLLVGIFILLVGWLVNTPPGLLGKADAIGYAVCHRIPERSFFLGDRPTPLCARCSGMYLGALVALLYQMRLGRKGGLPSLKIAIVLGIFLIAFGVDGLNSYLHLFPGAPHVYSPHNVLRLITGIGLGVGMTSMLLPIFHQTLWMDWQNTPLLSTWKQLLTILLFCALVGLAVYSEIPILLYPLALLSAGTILALLTMIYTLVWTMVGKRENKFRTFREILPLLLGGFATALVQIAIMDYARYIITGTWNGFFA